MSVTRRAWLFNAAAWSTIPLVIRPRRSFGQAVPIPRLHALIIGIDAYTGRIGVKTGTGAIVYRPISPLRGCKNDAEGIASVVRPLAASTRLIRDQEIDRRTFIREWRALVARSSPGDTLLVTYAGHGGQEAGPVPSRHPDGLHDTFIMPSLDTSKPDLSGERILDDEVQALWKSVEGRNRIVFLADSCHAGGMTRLVDCRLWADLHYRTAGKYDIEDDLADTAPLPLATQGLEAKNVVFLSGAQHHELVPEVKIEGRYQGVLSYAFAKALSGLADTNRDGVITGAELGSYVLRVIRTVSESVQNPYIRWSTADVRTGVEVRPEQPMFEVRERARPGVLPQPALRLRVLNASEHELAEVARELRPGSVVVVDEAPDLVWDRQSGHVLNRFGNVIARDVVAKSVQHAVDAARAVGAVMGLVVGDGLDLRLLLPGETLAQPQSSAANRTHHAGTHLTLAVGGLKYPNFVAFNVTGNGTVELLYPSPARPSIVDPSHPPNWKFYVRSPFGGDHAIGVNSAQPLDEFASLLQSADQQKKVVVVTDALIALANRQETLFGMQGIFTADGPTAPSAGVRSLCR